MPPLPRKRINLPRRKTALPPRPPGRSKKTIIGCKDVEQNGIFNNASSLYAAVDAIIAKERLIFEGIAIHAKMYSRPRLIRSILLQTLIFLGRKS